VTYQAANTGPQQPMARTCRVMLCHVPALGLVRLNVLVNGVASNREVPCCRDCSDAVADAIEHRRRPALTPDGELYMDDLSGLLRGMQ
jgi:hypothetical protein